MKYSEWLQEGNGRYESIRLREMEMIAFTPLYVAEYNYKDGDTFDDEMVFRLARPEFDC